MPIQLSVEGLSVSAKQFIGAEYPAGDWRHVFFSLAVAFVARVANSRLQSGAPVFITSFGAISLNFDFDYYFILY